MPRGGGGRHLDAGAGGDGLLLSVWCGIDTEDICGDGPRGVSVDGGWASYRWKRRGG